MSDDKDVLVEACIVNAVNAHDRQALRNARRLAKHAGINFLDLVVSGSTGIQAYIKDFRDAVGGIRLPAAFVEGNRLAGDILRATARVRAARPDLALPEVSVPELDWLHQLPRAQIETFAMQIEGWTPPYQGERGTTGTGEPITRKSAAEYRHFTMLIPTLLARAGLAIEPTTDLATCTEPDSLALWIPEFKSHYNKSSLRSKSPMIKRVVTDVLGPDHPNVTTLKSALRPLTRGSEGIGAEEVERARNLGRADTCKYVTIWSVPELIEARAEAPLLSVADRDSRSSCALASRFVIRRLFTPEMLVQIHLIESIREVGGKHFVSVTCKSQVDDIPLNEELVAHIGRVIGYRQRHGIVSMWLFYSRGRDEPQAVMSAMADLSRNIHAVLGARLNPSKLRSAVLISAADTNPNALEDIADAARLKNMQWAAKKLRIPLQSPLHGPGLEDRE